MMSGKTYINGTAYEISPGKAQVNGTTYNITQGKTLINGVTYDIKFQKIPTLIELFSTISLTTVVGVDASNADTYYGNATLNNSSIPQTGTLYLFSIAIGNLGIYKFVNGQVISTPLYRNSSSYGGLWHRTTTYNWWYHSDKNPDTATTSKAAHGITLALVQFQNNDNWNIDRALANIYSTRRSYHNSDDDGSTDGDTVKTNNKADQIYFACNGPYFDIYTPNGTTYRKLAGTATSAASLPGAYINIGFCYGGSIIGIS